MSYIQAPVTAKKYPLRYWMMLIYAVGLPNFVKFDETGLTHKTGLLNFSSIEGIGQVFIFTFFMIAMAVMNRQRLIQRHVDWSPWIWAILCVNLSISTILMAPNRLTPASHTNDVLISLFRIFCWGLALAMFLSVYSREPEETATDFIVRTLGICCWFNIAVIWVVLPFAPGLAYGADADAPETTRRLGGIVISPLGLGVLAGLGFFYALLFWRGRARTAGCCLAFVTLFLTYARAQQMSFLILLVVYLLFVSKRPIYRWGAVILLVVGIALGTVFSGEILSYEARGNGVNNILTLSERTYVWEASMKAFWLKPLQGYGVGKGVQNAIREQWTFTHWIPPESHNEIIQALVSGGVLAGVLVLYLYLQTLWKAFRMYRHGPKEIFLLLALLQVTLMSIGESIITVGFGRTSALFALVFIGVNGSYRRVRATLHARSQKARAAAAHTNRLAGV